MSLAPETPSVARPDVLLRVPVGFASPLWGIFAGAAVGASAWWWMTRWARPENLEAMFGAAAPEAPVALETVPASEPAPAAVIDPPELPAPVGGEAAPIAPALAAEEPAPEAISQEAEAEPKARVKKAEPKDD